AGFTRMTTSVFHYFMNQGHGHLAVISSIAGTKGLGIAPAYSATKRFQNTYMDALEQLACMKKANIHFTDIRPGFVATALLNNGKHYPLMMRPQTVAFSIKKALEKRKRVVIIDWKYQLIVAAWKLIPRLIWKRLRVKN
ncbi:MAG: SDR family NAD(P)-dependent oxidoreductase, partial [Phocaeicola sp.]|nr:SDR family NAD(P)-dependent oxidoreductase [Phocaeicola sp.]